MAFGNSNLCEALNAYGAEDTHTRIGWLAATIILAAVDETTRMISLLVVYMQRETD
jgi:hypothetical protein